MAKKRETDVELVMWDQLTGAPLPTAPWIRKEWRFHPKRKWRFDYAIWNEKVKFGIEIDGGGWIRGRHNTGIGKMKDDEKFNEAALLGWRILKFSPKQVLDGTAIAFINRMLQS